MHFLAYFYQIKRDFVSDGGVTTKKLVRFLAFDL